MKCINNNSNFIIKFISGRRNDHTEDNLCSSWSKQKKTIHNTKKKTKLILNYSTQSNYKLFWFEKIKCTVQALPVDIPNSLVHRRTFTEYIIQHQTTYDLIGVIIRIAKLLTMKRNPTNNKTHTWTNDSRKLERETERGRYNDNNPRF